MTDWSVLLLLLLLLLRSAMHGNERVLDALSVRRPQPHKTMPYRKKEGKENTCSRWHKRSEQLNPIIKHWHCSYNPPVPRIACRARSFHRDTEKGIVVLLYCNVLQRVGMWHMPHGIVLLATLKNKDNCYLLFLNWKLASHGIRTEVSIMTCILHRPERNHLHHRVGGGQNALYISTGFINTNVY